MITVPPRTKKPTFNKVDETVVNQENPVTSEEIRPSTEKPVELESAVVDAAPAHEVDDTVLNQESPGTFEAVDRNPEPQIVTNEVTGADYDISKSYPELVTTDPETEMRRAHIRQTEGVLNAKDIEGEDDVEEHEHIEIYFLESGLTADGRVWKAGQSLILEDNENARQSYKDTEGNVWHDLSASQQKERYGKVFFEKR